MTQIATRIPILLCFDSNYANYAAVATFSAFRNSKSSLIFYWIVTTESLALAERLKIHLQGFGIEIKLFSSDLSEFKEWKTGYHFTSANYLRLLASDFLLNENKVIYIDCDTLVLSDLVDLYSIDIKEFQFGGVIDITAETKSLVPRLLNDRYINSGVLLMNLEALRKNNFLEKSKLIYTKYQKEIIWVDQCIINKFAEGKKFYLDAKWNQQIFPNETKDSDFSCMANVNVSSIIHFVGDVKPWHNWCNPVISSFWWMYASQIGIKDLRPIEIKSVEALLKFSEVMHLNGHYENASKIKSEIINSLNDHIKKINENSVESRRLNLSKALNDFFGGVVGYGPFKGLRLTESSWWGAADRANMLLGIYEHEVLQSLQDKPIRYTSFIDIGAADGYYGVGAVSSGLFEKSWCFEASDFGRSIISQNAQINNVVDQVVIKGIADCGFYKQIPLDILHKSVLFVDIEGGEFELLNTEILEQFKHSIVFVELHEWMVPDGIAKLRKLELEAKNYFNITELTTTNRDLSVFKELDTISDSDRWLICSEGRPRRMRWWRLDPITSEQDIL